MVQIDMDIPLKCSECLIEKQDIDSYTFADGWDIHYYCPFINGYNKFYSISNKTDGVRLINRHKDCPLKSVQEYWEVMDNDKLEKVIKGMEQFRADLKPFCGDHADWERFDAGLSMLKEQEADITQLRLALDIAKGTCKGIKSGGG